MNLIDRLHKDWRNHDYNQFWEFRLFLLSILYHIYNHPIAVDLQNFYSEIMSRYFEVTNDYYVEYEKIRKARKVSSVLDLNNPGSESGE